MKFTYIICGSYLPYYRHTILNQFRVCPFALTFLLFVIFFWSSDKLRNWYLRNIALCCFYMYHSVPAYRVRHLNMSALFVSVGIQGQTREHACFVCQCWHTGSDTWTCLLCLSVLAYKVRHVNMSALFVSVGIQGQTREHACFVCQCWHTGQTREHVCFVCRCWYTGSDTWTCLLCLSVLAYRVRHVNISALFVSVGIQGQTREHVCFVCQCWHAWSLPAFGKVPTTKALINSR
jgi:post-segregation antitoxin (ccd killing protein)